MLDHLKKYHIILGSASPRRKELLSGLDIPFEVRVLPNVDETYPNSLQAEEIPIFLAQLKANAYRNSLTEQDLLITADTIVWLDGKEYGKPKTAEEAKEMLRTLSGRTHEVFTGVCISGKKWEKLFHAVSKVKFATLDEYEIDYYVKKYKPYDKAGAYGVQEWIGYIGVEALEGSFYNVMGLPVRMLYKHLKDWNK